MPNSQTKPPLQEYCSIACVQAVNFVECWFAKYLN